MSLWDVGAIIGRKLAHSLQVCHEGEYTQLLLVGVAIVPETFCAEK